MTIMPAAQVKALLVIASQLSGYPIPPDPLPTVELMTQPEMTKAACDDDPVTQLTGCGMLGFFNGANGELAVNAEEGGEVGSEQSTNTITVHELTHWLQWHNHAWHKDCPARFLIEFEAYKVGLTYQVKYEGRPAPAGFEIPPTACPFTYATPDRKIKSGLLGQH